MEVIKFTSEEKQEILDTATNEMIVAAFDTLNETTLPPEAFLDVNFDTTRDPYKVTLQKIKENGLSFEKFQNGDLKAFNKYLRQVNKTFNKYDKFYNILFDLLAKLDDYIMGKPISVKMKEKNSFLIVTKGWVVDTDGIILYSIEDQEKYNKVVPRTKTDCTVTHLDPEMMFEE